MLRALFLTLLFIAIPLHAAELKTATFAGGCFWCVEQAFDEIDGVVGNKPFNDPIITPIEPLKVFYPAEEYHQGYQRKNPVRYNFYKYSCGLPARLEELWGK